MTSSSELYMNKRVVLHGVFQDEHGDYPAGTYIRNPVGTHHIPRSDQGCVIFVKLWQFDSRDQDQCAIDLHSVSMAADPDRIGVSQAELVCRDYENVMLEKWEPGAKAQLSGEAGAEALILEGSLQRAGEEFARHAWIRLPAGHAEQLTAGDEGALVWVKRDHLANITVPTQVA